MKFLLLLLIVAAGIRLAQLGRRFALAVLLVWTSALGYLAFLSREPTYSQVPILDPFRALKRFWQFRDAPGTWKYQYLEGLLLNILLFVPLGTCTQVLLPEWLAKWWRVALLGFVVSLIVECLQYGTHLGSFDVADLFNNTVGTVLGWSVALKIQISDK